MLTPMDSAMDENGPAKAGGFPRHPCANGDDEEVPPALHEGGGGENRATIDEWSGWALDRPGRRIGPRGDRCRISVRKIRKSLWKEY